MLEPVKWHSLQTLTSSHNSIKIAFMTNTTVFLYKRSSYSSRNWTDSKQTIWTAVVSLPPQQAWRGSSPTSPGWLEPRPSGSQQMPPSLREQIEDDVMWQALFCVHVATWSIHNMHDNADYDVSDLACTNYSAITSTSTYRGHASTSLHHSNRCYATILIAWQHWQILMGLKY